MEQARHDMGEQHFTAEEPAPVLTLFSQGLLRHRLQCLGELLRSLPLYVSIFGGDLAAPPCSFSSSKKLWMQQRGAA